MWEKADRRGCKYTPMTQEELAEPLTPRSPTTENRATSRMTGSNPKQQVAIRKQQPAIQPKGTTSKSGSDGKASAKSTSTSSPSSQGIQVKQELGFSREPKGPPAPRLQSLSGLREQSSPRGTAGRSDWFNPVARGKPIGSKCLNSDSRISNGICSRSASWQQRLRRHWLVLCYILLIVFVQSLYHRRSR